MEFHEYLVAQNYSDATANQYDFVVNEFLNYVREHQLEENFDTIQKYLLESTAFGQKKSALKAYYMFLKSALIFEFDKLVAPKEKRAYDEE